MFVNQRNLPCFFFFSGGAGQLWAREEALASVVGVEMIDLPMSFQEVSVEKEFMSKGGMFKVLTSFRALLRISEFVTLQLYYWL
jgi:hypothetical protein